MDAQAGLCLYCLQTQKTDLKGISVNLEFIFVEIKIWKEKNGSVADPEGVQGVGFNPYPPPVLKYPMKMRYNQQSESPPLHIWIPLPEILDHPCGCSTMYLFLEKVAFQHLA